MTSLPDGTILVRLLRECGGSPRHPSTWAEDGPLVLMPAGSLVDVPVRISGVRHMVGYCPAAPASEADVARYLERYGDDVLQMTPHRIWEGRPIPPAPRHPRTDTAHCHSPVVGADSTAHPPSTKWSDTMSTTDTTTTTTVSYLRGTGHRPAPAYLVVERPGRHDPRYREGVVVVTVGLSTAWLLLSTPRPQGPDAIPRLCGEELDRRWGGPDGRGGHYRETVQDCTEANLEALRAEINKQLALHPYAEVWGCRATIQEDSR